MTIQTGDSESSFAARYATLSVADLHRLAEDVKDLVPDAREALRVELKRRHISMKAINWGARQPRYLSKSCRVRKRTGAVGDKEGEHEEISRSNYSAWVHVWISFVLECSIFAILFRDGLRGSNGEMLAYPLAVAVGLLIYWDRWRCIEAQSSQFCFGIFNISIIYVPLIAVAYANYRGIKKLVEK